ncbi:MAG: hypothetical protein WDO68_21830 [Gammaproteobacteria bacterium]
MKTPVLWHACALVAFGCLASGPSLAQSGTDCSSVADDMSRLKCYDEQAARQKKKTAAPPVASTPAPAASTPKPAAPSPAPAKPAAGPDDFGLDAEAVRRKQAAANPDAPREPEQVVARVKAVTTRPRGEYRITLEDGQVWDQTQHSASDVPPEAGETVTIKRGMLGSYFLSRAVGMALRVKRIN